MDIAAILGVQDVRDVKSVVCVQPHPDDNEVGAGGTLALLAAAGCRIVFVTVTDGRYGSANPAVNPLELAAIRRRERDEAGRLLSVSKQIDLGFADGGDYSEFDVMKALVKVLRSEQPELVMTVDPWMPYEAHPDHVKTGRAVAAAVLNAGNISFPEAGSPCRIPQVAFYASSYPNVFIDVTSHWQTKMAAILAHKSQFDNEEWPLLQQFFAYQAAQAYAAGGIGQSNADGAAAGTGVEIEAAKPDSAQPEPTHSDPAPPQRFAEAFKVLAARQLHFFPMALYS